MGNSFMTWLLAAALAGLGLFLFLGSPDGAAVTETSGSLTTSGAAPTSYWQDARSAVAAAPVAPAAVSEGAPCASCSTAVAAPIVAPPVVATPAPVALAGGCGGPAIPCGGASCGPVKTCPAMTPNLEPVSGCDHAVCPACGCSHCGHAGAACEAPACGECPATTCDRKPDCASCPAAPHRANATCPVPSCDDRPRISRHGAACVDECTFLQFFGIVPKSMCGSARFEWGATRGRFLDPTSPTPLYYAPSTALADGEDVLITLTVTDGQGNEYVDQLKLHVNDSE